MSDYPTGVVSLEVGRELKVAGLEHKSQVGDWYVRPNIPFKGDRNAILTTCPDRTDKDADVWLPTTDDCLAEIERRGWRYMLDNYRDKYSCATAFFSQQPNPLAVYESIDTTRPDAAGKCLLWILQREKSGLSNS